MKNGTKISVFNCTFWDLWLQKVFRNFASMKYQWMLLLYIPVIKGMFDGKWIDGIWVSKIGVVEGLAFLGGGFITLAVSRLIAKTTLTEDDENGTVLTNGDGEKILDTDD